MLECAAYSRGSQFIPSGCDWYGEFGASGITRVEVRNAVAGAVVIGLIVVGLFLRRARKNGLPGLVLTLAGLGIGIAGTWQMGSIWHPIGLAVYGLGLVLFGLSLRKNGTRKLGTITLVIAAFALLGAIDHGIYMIPWISVSPALLRVIFEVIWIPWALGAIIIGPRHAQAPPADPAPVREPALV
jgi:hypothetical protein